MESMSDFVCETDEPDESAGGPRSTLHLTGWETIVFELEDEDGDEPFEEPP